MLEGLAAWVLNTYVGEYLENLNTDQLSIGLLQGAVELENLPLKKDALKSLDLPLEVKAGFVGRITLQIPVRRVKSEPWVISIDRLYLVAGPLVNKPYNETLEKKAESNQKKKQLEALEAKYKPFMGHLTHRMDLQMSGSNQAQKEVQQQSGSSSWWAMGTSLATNILENLQLIVKDVHIRYEDDQTIRSCPFACGIIIKSLSAQSTDGTWVPKFVSRYDTDIMHKLVDLRDFSMYWDTDAAMVGDLPVSELADALQRDMGVSASTKEFKEHDYILEPVSASAKMKRNTSLLPLRSPSSPRILLDIQLDAIPVTLSEAQYRTMVAWMREFERHDRSRKYRRWRPACTVKESPSKWWKFAISANHHFILERNKRLTLQYLIQRAKDNVQYVEAYIQYLTSPYIEPSLKNLKDKMEEELTFEEVKLLRDLAIERVEEIENQNEETNKQEELPAPPPAPEQQSQGYLRSWFPGWTGWYYSATSPTEAPPIESSLKPPEKMIETPEPPEAVGDEEDEDKHYESPPAKVQKIALEQEIMDVIVDSAENNTLLKRDTVFAKLNFSLKSGSFKLRSSDQYQTVSGKKSNGIVEIECSEITMGFESRPRTSSLKFSISVGGLFLRDAMTTNSTFPVLVAPQSKERSSQTRQYFGVFSSVQKASYMQPGGLFGLAAGSANGKSAAGEDALFELIYEQKPPGRRSDHRLEMKTKPLDIIYNPAATRRISEFFTTQSYKLGVSASQSELQLTAAARNQYEKLKSQTKAEIKQTLDQLLEGEEADVPAERWEINLDIAAPQIIIPDNFQDQNTSLVVFDFGRLQFLNTSSNLFEKQMNRELSGETDDDFQTPPATPPTGQVVETPKKEQPPPTFSELFASDITETALHDKLYDKYTLDLSELQVMVGRAKDNWRYAHTKGTSQLHVIDRFSISLQLERRLVYTSEPEWPSVTLSGNLPSLVMHVNEQKVQALNMCINRLSGPNPASSPHKPVSQPLDSGDKQKHVSGEPENKLQQSIYNPAYRSTASLAKEMAVETKLLLMQFAINHVSLDVQSRGHSIAELQVSGVKANFTKRPYDTSVALTVHSLLIVDALQTYGPDFELLVASHKNVCLDSQSGSIRDSEPNSPISPMSPRSPSSPGESMMQSQSSQPSYKGIQAAISTAFQAIVSPSSAVSKDDRKEAPGNSASGAASPADRAQSPFMPITPAVDQEALITIEFEKFSPNCPSNSSPTETLQIATIQFNNLDLIANQQTVVELLSFFNRVLPSVSSSRASAGSKAQMEKETEFDLDEEDASTRTEVTADFHRLNVLLMRGIDRDGEVVAKKVATATLTGAHIRATLGGALQIEGSLDGLQLIDLTPEGVKHQKVLSVGHDPTAESSLLPYNLLAHPQPQPSDMYKTATESMVIDMSTLGHDSRAFTFSLSKASREEEKVMHSTLGGHGGLLNSKIYRSGGAAPLETTDLTLRMASLCYIHSPRFLSDISKCMKECHDYLTGVASSVKHAATEVAMGLVHKRSELLGASVYGSNLSLDGPSGGRRRKNTSLCDLGQDDLNMSFEEETSSLKLNIDAVLETPVIVLPKMSTSAEVLVAHLGKISIKSSNPDVIHAPMPLNLSQGMFVPAASFEPDEPKDKIYLEIRNMNLFSMNLEEQKAPAHQPHMLRTGFMTSVSDRYARTEKAISILHDTTIELTLEQQEQDMKYINQTDLMMGQDVLKRDTSDYLTIEKAATVLQVNGKVVSPLKVVLSKQVYEQILKSLDNLTYKEDTPPNSEKTLMSITEETSVESGLESSSSSVKLDDLSSASCLRDRMDLHESLQQEEESPMTIKIDFELPTFAVEMRGDFGEGEQGAVDLKFQDFVVNYEKSDPHVTSFEVTLGALVMDDLLQSPSSKHRHLMVSSAATKNRPSSPVNQSSLSRFHSMSVSCPDSNILRPIPSMPPSLPSSFRQENVFASPVYATRGRSAAAAAAVKGGKASRSFAASASSQPVECPGTPPPSPRLSQGRENQKKPVEDALVHINVLLVDRKSPEYTSKYHRTNRFIDVDFSCLDTCINLQTWVVVLDFLGMGAKVHDLEKYTKEAADTKKSDTESGNLDQSLSGELEEEVINTELELNVQSLTLILNKSEYELARANVSHVDARVSMRDGNFAVVGNLGSMSLQDSSPHGQLYRERFMTTGDQALQFDFFKYGTPDPDLLRENDMRLKLRMSSVRYIHTNRFIQETLAFVQHFNQLQDVLGRMRAASAGQKISDVAFRGSRIAMDIEAGAPVILIPHSSKSRDILVANLGTLTVNNQFKFAGTEHTIAYMNKKEKEAAAATLEAHNAKVDAEADEISSFKRDLSTMGDESLETSGLETSDTAASSPSVEVGQDAVSLFASDAMTSSVYGSLEQDWRSTDSLPVGTPPVMADSLNLELGDNDPEHQSTLTYPSPGIPEDSLIDFSTSSAHTSQASLGGSTGEASGGVGEAALSQEAAAGDVFALDPAIFTCLLDIMQINLMDMDLFSAEWKSLEEYTPENPQQDLLFAMCVIQRQGGKLLKEKCHLKLQVERNLCGDLSHAVPDFNVRGALSSVYCSIDVTQYKLVRGFLDHNLGEQVEEFRKPLMSNLQDPKIHTVLSGEVWKGMAISIDLNNVTVELLIAHEQPGCPEASLAKLDFIKSRLMYESFSDGSKDIDLVSHEILSHDTRYRDAPANNRPSVFVNILQPTPNRYIPGTLQMEVHYRSCKEQTRFTVLLNNMRLMGIFDWLLAVGEFLLTKPDDPFGNDNKDEAQKKPSSTGELGKGDGRTTQSPVTVSGGIATKRAPIVEKVEAPFELKLNVTDTELVVVEDMSAWDTNAVILKSTAILSYRPKYHERPLACNLSSLEVFSCSLAAEDDTALSIIDPMTVTMELNGSPIQAQKAYSTQPCSLLDATMDENKPPILEVSFNTLNVRLSYNDLMLFMAIMNSLPQQALQARNANQGTAAAAQHKWPDEELQKLQHLGFALVDCEKALTQCEGKLDDAAMWLTQNTTPVPTPKQEDDGERSLQMSGVDIKASSICVCLIDDCKDADVPLAELTFNNFQFLQKLDFKQEGKASFKLAGDYYNRSLSGWEPFLETWGCQLDWHQVTPESDKLAVKVRAAEVLNINLTSVLIEQYQKVKQTWTEDYYKTGNIEDSLANSLRQAWSESSQGSQVSLVGHRRRTPFVPFAIRNETNCALWFATVTTNPTSMALSSSSSRSERSGYQSSEWKRVLPGTEIPFTIEGKDKIRHKHTHELKVHKLVVKVDGWQKVTPVSVDKVGIYFRQAKPEINKAASIFSELPPARIVFEVTLDGSARKLITVRSALVLVNNLEEQIEIKLDNSEQQSADKCKLLCLAAKSSLPIPLPYVSSRLWVRPKGCWSLAYCNKPILWHHIRKPGETNDGIRICNTQGEEDQEGAYRFCVQVQRLHYPIDLISKKRGQQSNVYVQPGHVITLMPPVTIVNLLPFELAYYMKGTDIKGNIRAGKEASLFSVDLSQPAELGIMIENFTNCRHLVIPPGTTDYFVKLRVYDTQNRLLQLGVRIQADKGGSLKLSISAPYWFVNKSGLPLIFRQLEAKQDTAGQYEEHELARSVTPLLFSFAEREAPHLTTMRLGRSVHGPGTVPQWCQRFSPESGMGMRHVHVVPTDSRPDWLSRLKSSATLPELSSKRGKHGKEDHCQAIFESHVTFEPAVVEPLVYYIGIEVRQGRGRYIDTNIVTFSPRFQLDNRSSHKLAFAQRHLARTSNQNNKDHLSAMPSSSLAFHWPRVDLDQLLCVRMMDDPHCHWSGGFRVDKVHSFHINMRGESCQSLFLRVDIVLQGATFYIVFTDADHMPPPFRIDNFSEVPIVYFQTKVVEERLRSMIKARSSVPYAWDEPTLPPHITCSVPGGTMATYNMNSIADGDQLCYENFIYIAFTGTFNRSPSNQGGLSWQTADSDLDSRELVLDVPNGTGVVLSRKCRGQRSQLWRMTFSGMLQHEGSSEPRDPRGHSSASSVVYVLDISDIAPQPGRQVSLMLRKADERRKSTQTWHFTQDGRLACSLDGLYVQAREGVMGLKSGCDAVLGQASRPITRPSEVPIEMAVGRQKMRPGSGYLSVKVVPDGPTRVLQIMDIRNTQLSEERNSGDTSWVLLKEKHLRPALNTDNSKADKKQQQGEEEEEGGTQKPPRDLEVSLSLTGGICISLVNQVPEELICISLKEIIVDFNRTDAGQIFDASIKHLQVNNQLFGSQRPVLLYQSPSSRESSSSGGGGQQRQRPAALRLLAHKMPNQSWNADIFKHLQVEIAKLTLQIEEVLLWKMYQFFGYSTSDLEIEKIDESNFDSQKALVAATSVQARRYYFGMLKICTHRITLSMLTSSKLPPDLQNIKQLVGLKLVNFEEAKVELDPFSRTHPFETCAFLIDSMTMHYTEELKSQAAKILGSVDFLGNPLGLFNDVTEGISGLIKDGNVGGLFQNVTHGSANTLAKVAGSLSTGLHTVAMDQQHIEERGRIMENHSGSGKDHLIAGIRGLGHGILGGMTSIFSQTYEGVRQDGLEGLFTGLGKGMIGTVTKPVAGVLDAASATAFAVRYTSRSSQKQEPVRTREPRCCFGPGGLLPPYSEHHAQAQKFLYKLNDQNYAELYIAMEHVRPGRDSLRVLITNEMVYFLGKSSDSEKDNIMLLVVYDELYHCRTIGKENKYAVELTMKADNTSGVPAPHQDPKKRPIVRCDSEAIARKVTQQINYAKNLYDERKQTLMLESEIHQQAHS